MQLNEFIVKRQWLVHNRGVLTGTSFWGFDLDTFFTFIMDKAFDEIYDGEMASKQFEGQLFDYAPAHILGNVTFSTRDMATINLIIIIVYESHFGFMDYPISVTWHVEWLKISYYLFFYIYIYNSKIILYHSKLYI